MDISRKEADRLRRERKEERDKELEKMRGSGKVKQVVKELEPNSTLVDRMIKSLDGQRVDSHASHIVNAGRKNSKGPGFER